MKRYILIWRTSLFLVVSNEMCEGGFVSPLYTIKQLFLFHCEPYKMSPCTERLKSNNVYLCGGTHYC